MVFDLIVNLFASSIIVLRRFILLIFFPYKTLRRISQEKDYSQVIIIFFLVFIYFKFAYFLRGKPYPASLIFLIFFLIFFSTTGFLYLLSRSLNKKILFSSFVFSFAYSLFPTLIWFISCSLLYIILPPPRTLSILGKGFSIFFIAFSISLLVWKLILFYLSLRFSSRLKFYWILYMMILYLIWFIPCSIFLYYLKIFRIPFI